MPNRLHLQIFSQTRSFNKVFKLWFCVKDFSLYLLESRSGMAVVTIYRSSNKCYRVMVSNAVNTYLEHTNNMSEYKSFRTQAELILYLDSFCEDIKGIKTLLSRNSRSK